MHPLISIIVPVYNLEQYVKNTIESILAQSYTNIEIIAVDDGSADSSAAVLDALSEKDSRLRVFHKKNGGVTSARLFGIEQARGDYIGFVDGDDIIDSDMYERLLNNALENDADISHCGYEVIKIDGTKSCFYGTHNCDIFFAEEATKKLLLGNYEPSLCTKIFKIALVKEILQEQKIDTSVKINEDLLLNFLLFQKAQRIFFEDFCPYHYIKREDSASSRSSLCHIFDPIKVRRFIFDELQNTELEQTAKSALLTAYRNSYNRILLSEEKIFQPIQKEIRKALAENKAFIRCLSWKDRFLYALILYAPPFYKLIYHFYVRRRDTQ